VARRIVPGIGEYVPGETLTPITLNLASGPHAIGGLICYEGVFPQYARQFSANGAELLVNLTNDAWYGISAAATQHLAFYAMRAAENGRAVARAANTGISCGIDPAGRVVAPSRLFEDQAVVVDLPFMTSRSIYNVTGDLVGGLCALLFAAGLGHALKGWYVARRLARADVAGQAKVKRKT
jgi:apolipoprotein N-acyltransferase